MLVHCDIEGSWEEFNAYEGLYQLNNWQMGFHIFEYIRIIKDMHQERTYKAEPKHSRQKLTGAHLLPCPKAWENSHVFSA